MNPGLPLVSFVIPAYNAAKTLPRTLQSLLGQTEVNWEAVVIDDGSKDRTSAVVRTHSVADRRIRLLKQKNGGAAAARNLGIKDARAPYVVFLDADDWIEPAYLETMLPLITDEDIIAYCAYRRVLPSGREGPADWCPELQTDAFQLLARRCEPAIHCVVAPRQLVVDVGGFDPGLRTCEDWDLWLRLARAGARFVGTPEILANYRMRPHSLSTEHADNSRDAELVQSRALAADERVRNPASEFINGWQMAPAQRLVAALALEVDRLTEGQSPSALWLEDAFGPDWAALAPNEVDNIATQLNRHLSDEPDVKRRATVKRNLVAGATKADQWLGEALADAFDRLSLEQPDSDTARTAGRWLAVELNASALPESIEPPPGCDALLVTFTDIGNMGVKASLAMVETVERNELVQILIDNLPVVHLLRAVQGWRSARFWQGVFRQAVRIPIAGSFRNLLHPRARRVLFGDILRAGLASQLAVNIPLKDTRNITGKSAAIFHFGRLMEQDCGLLEDCLGIGQLHSLIDLIAAEEYSAITLADLSRARVGAHCVPEKPVALVFAHAASFMQLGVSLLLQKRRMCADLLLTLEELGNDEFVAQASAIRHHGVRFGLRAERLPMQTSQAISFAAHCFEKLRALNGDNRVSAMSPNGGLPDAICKKAGFAPILSSGSAQVKLDGYGTIFTVIPCSGSEALGTVFESLRPAT